MKLNATNIRPAVMRRMGNMPRTGYATGGAIDEAEDKKIAAKAVHRHEEHDHPGKPLTKLKSGGIAHGKEPAQRLDKKSRKAGGGEVYKSKPEVETLHPKEKYVNVDQEKIARAHGGRTGKKGKTQIIIHAGGGGDQQNPMALQQAKQQGEQEGAMKVMGALKAKMAGAGGPPGGAPPMGGGMPPPGAGAPPPPGGAPPPMAGPPPMRKDGGEVKARSPKGELPAEKRGDRKGEMIEVKAHHRRRGGACT